MACERHGWTTTKKHGREGTSEGEELYEKGGGENLPIVKGAEFPIYENEEHRHMCNIERSSQHIHGHVKVHLPKGSLRLCPHPTDAGASFWRNFFWDLSVLWHCTFTQLWFFFVLTWIVPNSTRHSSVRSRKKSEQCPEGTQGYSRDFEIEGICFLESL